MINEGSFTTHALVYSEMWLLHNTEEQNVSMLFVSLGGRNQSFSCQSCSQQAIGLFMQYLEVIHLRKACAIKTTLFRRQLAQSSSL